MKKNILFLLVLISFAACQRVKDKPAETPAETSIPVKAVAVEQKTLDVPIHCTGILTSKAEIKLAFKTGGVIERIYVREGQFVRKGQILAQLNLAEINSQVIQAKAALEKSGRDVQRVRNLYADSVSTLEQVQNASTGQEVASASLRIAEFNRQYSTIVAPANGRILKRMAEPNEITAPGNPVFLLSSADEAWVVTVGLADRDLVRIKEGDRAELSLDAYPGQIFQAAVSQIDETTNRGSGTYEVELQINPAGRRLVSGFVAKGELLPSQKLPFLVIPIEALTEADGGKGYVYVLEPGGKKVSKIQVTVAAVYKNQVAVSQGLSVGQQVVTAGVAYLTPGAEVVLR
jgi:RND family efflux transporter MFP subunit